MRTVIKETTVYFTATLAYAIIRYNIIGPVPYADIPTFILNKAVSFTMIIVLLRLAIAAMKHNQEVSKQYKKTFKVLLSGHVLLSLILLSKAYYPKFYGDGRLTLMANFAILSAVVATVYIFAGKTKIKTWIVALLAGFHLSFIGAKGWLTIDKWHGSMPPITLLCFILVVTVLALEVKSYLVQGASVRKKA